MKKDMQEIFQELRRRLKEAVERNPAEGILLSGGLDSSIIAFLSPKVKMFNITLENQGEDPKFARILSQKLGLRLHQRGISLDEAFKAIPEVIKVRRSFDPALPNDLAIYFALKLAAEEGVRSVATGDGADELFCGYSYMFNLDLENYIPKLVKNMFFSANELGPSIGIDIKQPFLDKDFIAFALSINPDLKFRENCGKWVLRKAFEGFLPKEIVWQEKRPIEQGTGFARLREEIALQISDEELRSEEIRSGVKFISKDHLFYYRIYRKVVGEIPKPKEGEGSCPGCGAGIKSFVHHCRVCGWSGGLIQT